VKKVYIGIGSNISPRRKFFDDASKLLLENSHIKHFKTSHLYESKPQLPANSNQNKYLNAVASFETDLTSDELLNCLNNIENTCGRKRANKGDPRTIDLDILLFGNMIIHTPDLTIPHKSICERMFVLKPFCDIAGEVIHPEHGVTMKKLMEDLETKGGDDEIIHRHS